MENISMGLFGVSMRQRRAKVDSVPPSSPYPDAILRLYRFVFSLRQLIINSSLV